MRVGGIVYNNLTGGGTEKRGGETKILKKDGKLGGGGGSWNPLANYVIHALNILRECIERNSFFKIGEQFNDLMID